MNRPQIETFIMLKPQIESAYEEIGLLSIKKPTEELNPFKLKFINNILSRANKILGIKYKPFPEDFDLFSEDDMPNNSDVVFILSHYLTSLEKLRCDNIGEYDWGWYWMINGKNTAIKTEPPKFK